MAAPSAAATTDMIPIILQERLKLSDHGIAKEAIGFRSCSFASDLYITVRNTKPDGRFQVVMIDLHNTNNVRKHDMTAEQVIMSPNGRFLALKAKQTLQLFNLESQSKTGAHEAKDEFEFWKWLDDTTLAIITRSSVYHWKVDAETPQKMFDRHQCLAGTQIIDYVVNDTITWAAVIGIKLSDEAPGNQRVIGKMQLWNSQYKVSQELDGNAAAFAVLTKEVNGADVDAPLIVFASRNNPGAGMLRIIETIQAPNGALAKHCNDIPVFFPDDAATDYPVNLTFSKKYGLFLLATKFGYIHLYEVESQTCIYMNRISMESIFRFGEPQESNGLLAVNKGGQVFSVTIDDSILLRYIAEILGKPDLAIRLAIRHDLAGIERLYTEKFMALYNAGDYENAVVMAAKSPKGFLRTQAVVDRLKTLQPTVAGQPQPIIKYFSTIIHKNPLNQYESVALANIAAQTGKIQIMKQYLEQEKLTSSEELGDVLRPHDPQTAVKVYHNGNNPAKVIECLIDLGKYDRITSYAQSVNFQPDYTQILQLIMRRDPDKGAAFAKTLVDNQGTSLADIERIVDIFMSQNLIQQVTSFLLDVLQDKDTAEYGHLQTRLLEMNLMHAPQVADAILSNLRFSHYDRATIANLCEKAGLHQRALEHYDDINDIKRVIVHAQGLNREWIVNFFGKLTVDQTLECMNAMLKINIRENLQVVVQIATKYSELIGALKLIELFESFETYEGLYSYLGSIVNLSQDPDVHFKYIQAGVKVGQLKEVERVCRESNFYDPEKVKNFLKEAKLSDQLPLVIVCDRFNFVYDLVLFLHQQGLTKCVADYVQRANSARTPAFIGSLLDVDCDENVIKNFLLSVTGPVPVDELVKEVENRNRLKLILPWLQLRIKEGNTDPAVYNALAKIYIDSNNNPETFLKENLYYNSLIVGKYCEKRDPYLAFIAYQRGQCDDELIKVTNENQMFKHQARYLVKRREIELWKKALDDSNMHRKALIDQIIATVLPETSDPEEVAITVKAFTEAGLSIESMPLGKLALEQTAFSDHTNLQNLLILIAIKADRTQATGLLDRLNNYNAANINARLYEEVLLISKKQEMHIEAVNTLIEHIAERANTSEVWSLMECVIVVVVVVVAVVAIVAIVVAVSYCNSIML